MTLIGAAQPTFAQTLVLAVENDAAPWSREDGTGYANELVEALYESVGIEVELKVMPYKRCKQLTVDGKIAGCFNMARIDALSEQIAFPDTPLFLEDIGYFHKTGTPLLAKTEAAISSGT